jgi:adenylate kinase family enzyme
MSSIIPENELQTFKSKNYRLIFCIGIQGCGIDSQIEKVCNEFKYGKIDIKERIKKEIELETDIGKQSKEYIDKNEPLPKDLLTYLIIHSSLENKEKQTILVNGFPTKLEDAQYFEQNISQIDLILRFNATEETCLRNLSEDPNNTINEEEFKKQFEEMNNNFNLLTEFYSPYSLIREIDCNQSIDNINNLLKQNLYPKIYSIIGKRYSGKTTLSKVLQEKTGIETLDFNEFLKCKELSKRKNDNIFITTKLINKLRQMRKIRVLIEDFPQNKEQYIYFINNCKNFEKIYYLDADNSSCLERLNNISLEDPNYTDSSTLSELLYEFELKKDFYTYLKQNSKVEEINVNNHLILTIKQMMKQIQPYCAYIEVDEGNNEKKNELFEKLKNNYKFFEIEINKIIENAKIRKIIGENIELSLEDKINLIRPLLFREECCKIILNTFPCDINESNIFESNLCQISKYIVLTDKKYLTNIKDENSMCVYFYNNNLLTILNPNEISDFKIEECLDMIKDISIVYGPPQSGKTTIAKHLKEKYNFEMLDFKDLIEQVKKTKIDPENSDAEPEITFQDLVEFLKNYLKNIKNKKLIVDNVFIPGGADPFLIDTYEKASEIIKIFGNFKTLYEASVDENNLLNKYKAKEGIAEEMNEEQKAAYDESLDKPKKLLEDIKSKSANIIKINCNEPEAKSLQKFDQQFGINIIVIKHDYDICLEKTLQLFSAKNKVLYINVPRLIYNHFYNNDSYAKKLESTYGRKKLIENIKDPDNFDEMVFYKYNPIKFEKGLVNQMILDYVASNSKIIEDSGNFVLLTGYLNYDLLENADEPFNLPLYELKNSMELGELTAFIQITRKEIKEDEDEKPEQLIIEKPKKKVETDPLDVDGPPGGEEEKPEEEAPPEEENPDGVPKFKPENFSWTYYDGKPRNYVQILKRLKSFPIKVVENGSCREELVKLIGDHMDNYLHKNENKYKGLISVIKVGEDVGNETEDEIKKITLAIGERKGIKESSA